MVVEPEEVGAAPTIGTIRAETSEQINRALLASAAEAKLERGRVVRLDSTVTAALMHEPSDSRLLWDAVRVMARLLKAAMQLATATDWAVTLWQAKVRHYQPLIERIITQAERRILHGEQVPAAAKLVSCSNPMPTSSARAARTRTATSST